MGNSIGTVVSSDSLFNEVIGLVDNIDSIKHVRISKDSNLPSYLFFGPHGNGKSFLAKIIGRERILNMLEVKNVDFSVGDDNGIKQLKKVFKQAQSFKKACLLVFEDIDTIIGMRGINFRNELKTQLRLLRSDSKGVMFIATTCHPRQVPEDVRMEFANILYFPIPTPEERELYLRHYLRPLDIKNNLRDADYAALANRARRRSFLDLEIVCKSQLPIISRAKFDETDFFREEKVQVWASANQLKDTNAYVPCDEFDVGSKPRRKLNWQSTPITIPLGYDMIDEAIRNVVPQVPADEIVDIEEWNVQFGRRRGNNEDLG